LETFASNEGASNLNTRLDAFWDAATATTGDPNDVALRRQMLSSGADFGRAMSGLVERLREGMTAVKDELRGVALEVTRKFAEVAELDAVIMEAGGRLASGDALDMRDHLVYEISELMGLDYKIAENQTAELYLGGHVVSANGRSRSLDFEQDPTTGEVSLFLSSGDGRVNVTDTLGGAMGGYIGALDQGEEWISELDTVASNFADTMNAQHALGFDSTGTAGGDLFTYDATDPAGSLSIAIDDPNALALASQVSANAGDAGNLDALRGLEDQISVGTRTTRQALSDWGSGMGGVVASAASQSQQQSFIQQDLEELHASMVGVSLDEEAALMIEAQTAYQANAKVIKATDQMFAVMLDLV
jgi:flagellar hook-associated protein 1 FlgK